VVLKPENSIAVLAGNQLARIVNADVAGRSSEMVDSGKQYTPGPWEADHCTEPSPNPGYFQIDAPLPSGLRTYAPYTVADTLNRDFRISPEEDEANARLIAAAPELLAAVKVAYEFFINPGKFNPLDVERLYEAAIRKAVGDGR
jgi:hypothetical protein